MRTLLRKTDLNKLRGDIGDIVAGVFENAGAYADQCLIQAVTIAIEKRIDMLKWHPTSYCLQPADYEILLTFCNIVRYNINSSLKWRC